MSFEVTTTPAFRRSAKRLVKKYPSLKQELANLADQLVQTPDMGTSLGNQIFKIRIAIQSKGKGTRGGQGNNIRSSFR